ncbi:MAG: hypothetical protein KDA25_01190, partial [Phycisphaerales bacterium]|nr:hypothetical protein [Phycisphaerales bacterium]
MTVLAPAVHRIEVRSRPGCPDARSDAALRDARAAGLDVAPTHVRSAAVYLIEATLDDEQVRLVADALLVDPVIEFAVIGATAPDGDAFVEVHPLPGVMDPDAEPIEMAIRALVGVESMVRSGRRYDLDGVDAPGARAVAERCYANTVVHAIHEAPYHPDAFPHGVAHPVAMPVVAIRDLDDAALERMSRDAHLFLSLEEMQTIRAEYRRLGRDPREIELETLAQTWFEHCVDKRLKATINYRPEKGVL